MDNPTQSDMKHLDDPTQSDIKLLDGPTQSDKKHINDPTHSDIKHLDDPTQFAKKHSDDPTQSDKKHVNDPTQSDKKHVDDPTQSDEKHVDDPTQLDEKHVDDQTRMPDPLKFPLKDIELVTNSFDNDNFIGKGFLGKIYEGQLPLSGELIDVAVRRLDYSLRLQEILFEKEISILTHHKHPNMVSIVGYCYENDEMLIISKRVARGSLRWHLSDPKLTWMRRLQISIGVVRALSYLHEHSIIHHNINSDSILLDENWEAKISGFEFSMTIPTGSLDLAYEKLGIRIYKSDVFSIGIVLFELLCRREAFISKEDNSFQAPLAIFHFENRTLNTLVDPDLFKQMDQLSFNIFSKIAYKCLINQKTPPNMNEIHERLEKALKAQQMHENNDSPIAVERTIPDHLKLKLNSLEHMRIPLVDILDATEKFASKYCIVSGGYGSIYTAELDHVDKAYCSAIERGNEGEIPKKRSPVAIKRIINTEDEIAEQGFYAEIEMLTSYKHSNIITLLGFCDEGSAMILIYEYASNRSLNYYLQNWENNSSDSWAQRVKICLDAAKGLSHLHTTEGDQREIVHRDIKSANILLDENFEAKIGDFGLSIILSVSEKHYTPYSRTIAGTRGYMDPQYREDGKLKKESDVYSFGVVLFEVLFGTLAYDPKYTTNAGLARVARHHFKKGTIKDMVYPKIKEEISETLFTSVTGPNQESLDRFSRIAYECLEEEQGKRPTMKAVVEELEKALFFHKNRKDIFKVSFEDLQLATNNFSDDNVIEEEGFWRAYRGEVICANGSTTSIVVKRLFSGVEGYALSTELKVLMEHKHENVIGFLGYCEEGEERIIVYEHALNGSLANYLDDYRLTWVKRLKICIGIANGLDFLHGGSVTGEVVIHRDIKSRNILLDADMNVKIASFGLSVIHPLDQEAILLNTIAGTEVYLDPEYEETGLLSKECDIYSFGIVLFEMLLRRLAYSVSFEKEGHHLGPLIKDLYKKGKLDEMMYEGTNEQIAPQSLTIFKRIAIQCLHDKREERPTAGEVMIQLKQALNIQEKGMNVVRIPLADIKKATDNFSDEKIIGRGGFGKVFKGQLPHANGEKSIAAKRLDRKHGQGDDQFYRELEILFKFKHRNVIGLEGYCDEMDERIIVYEYASNKSLDNWLDNGSLTWMQRLEICIGIASGLDFLHGGALRQEAVIHRDSKSSNILITWDWEAKIADFGLSLISPNNQEIDYVIEEELVGTPSYVDPAYIEKRTISKASDVYTFGVVLFEILCGRLAYQLGHHRNDEHYLAPLAKNYYEQRKLDELVFEGIKEQIDAQSLSTFADIAYKCLHHDRHQRPTAGEVVAQLKEAKEFQVDCETWEPKLPSDYKEIIRQSRTHEICGTKKKKDLYEMLCEGILIQKGRVWFSLDSNNKRNEMISPTLFIYQNQSSQKWRHNRKSRFQRVPLIMDISNLKIQAKIKAQFLTPSVTYGVYLVFKFVEPTKISSEPKYVNLKYKMGNETLHAYFATWRKDKWMMIELCRFLNNKDGGDFEVLLDSFSRCYCGNGGIYVEGIEFRAIDNVTHEENEKSKDAQQIMRSNSNMGQMQQFPADNDEILGVTENSDETPKPSEMNGNRRHIISAKEVLYDSSNVKLFKLKPSEQSRFGEVIEVLSQQVFRIKCKIKSEILSPNTDYSCYLIFKLSEKCRGLHCPVKVRGVHRPVKVEGQFHQSSKETKDLYFRTPKEWNIHDINQVPKQREDGWMEVNVWKFNSKDQLRNDCIHLNLKLISYEGTMSGLMVCGLELQPM